MKKKIKKIIIEIKIPNNDFYISTNLISYFNKSTHLHSMVCPT